MREETRRGGRTGPMVAVFLILGILAAWWIRSLEITDSVTLAANTRSGILVTTFHGSVQGELFLGADTPDGLHTGIWTRKNDLIEPLSPFGQFEFQIHPGSGFGCGVSFPFWLPILGLVLVLTALGWRFGRGMKGETGWEVPGERP